MQVTHNLGWVGHVIWVGGAHNLGWVESVTHNLGWVGHVTWVGGAHNPGWAEHTFHNRGQPRVGWAHIVISTVWQAIFSSISL